MGRPQTQYDPVFKVEDLIEKFETCSPQSTRSPGHPPDTPSPEIQDDRETALSSPILKKSKADILQVEIASTPGSPAVIIARPNSFQDEKAVTRSSPVLATANTNNILLESQPDIKVMASSSTQVSDSSNTINTRMLHGLHCSATREKADRIAARQYKSQAKAMVLRPAENLVEYIAKFEDLCRRGHYAVQEWEETLRDGLTDDLKRYLANHDTDGDFEASKALLVKRAIVLEKRQWKVEAKGMRLGPGEDICEYINKFEDLCWRSGYAEQEWHDTLREGLPYELQYFLIFREPDLSYEATKALLVKTKGRVPVPRKPSERLHGR